MVREPVTPARTRLKHSNLPTRSRCRSDYQFSLLRVGRLPVSVMVHLGLFPLLRRLLPTFQCLVILRACPIMMPPACLIMTLPVLLRACQWRSLHGRSARGGIFVHVMIMLLTLRLMRSRQ